MSKFALVFSLFLTAISAALAKDIALDDKCSSTFNSAWNGPVGELTANEGRATGGSTGGKWYIDQAGNSWFGKRDVIYRDLQTSAEVISSRIYRFFGYRVPETVKMTRKNALASFSKDIGPSVQVNVRDLDSPGSRQLKVVSAFLKDWDRRANPENNRLLANGDLVLIDFGGSLGSRAQGEHKPGTAFSKAIGSFEATDDISIIYDAFRVSNDPSHPWNNLTRQDAESIVQKFKALTDHEIEDIVSSAAYSESRDRDYMIKALKARRDGIIHNLVSRF